MPLNRERRKVLAGLINPDYQEEIGFKIHNGERKKTAWSPGDSLLHWFTTES